jgi:hopene-associated glycosyltransferase HpnB
MFSKILDLIAIISVLIWLYLIFGRGWFWLADRKIKSGKESELSDYPSICAIVPARDEADVIDRSLRSLLQQDYQGDFSIILVDDRSSDGTGNIAKKLATENATKHELDIILGEPLPNGWTGKLWAIDRGINYAIQRAKTQDNLPDYFLLTDADIQHDRLNLMQLVTKAETEDLELVSLMVLLRCQSLWEKLLIPAFIFFFQKLYPFPLVNLRDCKVAAAAGGCILVDRRALERIGGMQSLRHSLIDDCTLATKIKNSRSKDINNNYNKGIWLGLTESTVSLRPYPNLQTIWDMVARTAYYQLNYSPLFLIGTTCGMFLIYLAPVLSLSIGIWNGNFLLSIAGFMSWMLMVIAYCPTLKLYSRSPIFGLCLPLIALLYTGMTIDSALRYYQGKGGAWKGRVYTLTE